MSGSLESLRLADRTALMGSSKFLPWTVAEGDKDVNRRRLLEASETMDGKGDN